MYPLLLEDAGDIRQQLAAQGIFIPTLWPNVLEQCPSDSVAYRYSKDILPLPVDQRYGVDDMDIVAQRLLELLERH